MPEPCPSPYHRQETADERDRRYASERESDQRNLNERFAAQEKALGMALQTFPTQGDFKDMLERLTILEGQRKGVSASWVILLTVAGLLIAALATFAALKK